MVQKTFVTIFIIFKIFSIIIFSVCVVKAECLLNNNYNNNNNFRLFTNWQNTICLQAQYEWMITSYYRSQI